MASRHACRALRAAAQRSTSSKAILCTNGPVEVASKGFVLGSSRPSLMGQPQNWNQVPSFIQGLGDFAAPPSALVVSHSHKNEDFQHVDNRMPGMPCNEGSMAPVSSLLVRHSHEEQDVLGLESLLRMPCIAGESGY